MSNELYEGANGNGVEIFGMLLESGSGQPPTDADCQGWVAHHNTPYPVLNNGMYEVLDEIGQGGTIGLPLTYIIDANANIRFIQSGFVERAYMIDVLNGILETPYGPE